MDESLAKRITTNPEYIALVRRRGRFAWTSAAIPGALWIGFLACLAWAPGLMGTPVWGVMTVGMLWALVIIFGSVAVTGWYLRHSEKVFEPAQRKLLEHLKQQS